MEMRSRLDQNSKDPLTKSDLTGLRDHRAISVSDLTSEPSPFVIRKTGSSPGHSDPCIRDAVCWLPGLVQGCTVLNLGFSSCFAQPSIEGLAIESAGRRLNVGGL